MTARRDARATYESIMEQSMFLLPLIYIIAFVPMIIGILAGAVWRGIENGFHVGRNV